MAYNLEQLQDLINGNRKKHDRETKLLLKLNKVLSKFKPSEKEIKDYIDSLSILLNGIIKFNLLNE